MLLLSHNLILPVIWMSFNCFGYVVVQLKMPWVRYCLGGANFCLRSRQKISCHKMEGF